MSEGGRCVERRAGVSNGWLKPGADYPVLGRLVTDPGARQSGDAAPKSIRLELRGVPETLVIPLYAKALDFRSRRSILHDEMADEIVRSLEYDFQGWGTPGAARTRFLAARAREIDEWVRAFLTRHPNATVLNLGCGLDTRVSRLAPQSAVSWFDIDFPEVIEVRRKFFTEKNGYRMLSASLTEEGWLAEVPANREAIAVADGVLGYLFPEQVTSLFHRIVTHFPAGEAVFDVISSRAARGGRQGPQGQATALLHWFVDDLAQIDTIDPRLRRLEVRAILSSRYLPLGVRFAYGIVGLIPSLRRAIRLVRCEF